MNIRNGGTRVRLLSGVGTAVLATLIASGAQASPEGARTTIDQTGTPTVEGSADLSINTPLTNAGSVGASVTGAEGKIGQTGVQTGTSNTVSDNTIAAKAIGNTNQASIPALSSIGVEGAAILNPSINNPGGVVTSAVANSDLSVTLDGFASGSATNSGNTISADTRLNSASSSISGTVPTDYESSAPGMSQLSYPGGVGNEFDAGGTVVVSSVQQAIGTGQAAGSNASVTNNQVSLDLTSPANNTVASGPSVDNNAISATFKGNAASNTADIQAGGDPTFAGSAVVSNLQVNTADGASLPGDAAAQNQGSAISASVGSNTGVNTLNGSLSVAGNTIASAATGNEALGATGTTAAAGNRILLGDGMSITGVGIPFGGSNIAYDNGAVASTVAADLLIHNSQGNQGDGTTQSLDSVTEGASIGALVQSLDGGSVGVSQNSVTASTTGNNASNAIATGQNTGAFSATVAVANQQVNDASNVSARNSGGVVGATVGTGDGEANAGSVSVANNSVGASAYGNQVSQNVALQANSIDLAVGPAVLAGGTGPDGHVSATGGATVSNLQSRYNSAVTATNEGSEVALGSGAADTTGSTLAVTGNTQQAVGVGSNANNGLSLVSGTSLGSGAGISNVQIGGNNSAVTATLDGATAGVGIAGDLGDPVGSSVALTDNLQRAIGYGNSAANTLNVAGNSATFAAADETDRPSTISLTDGAANGLVFDNASAPTVTAAYGVLNDQSTLSNVSASAAGSDFRVDVGMDVQDKSSVSNDRNAFVAAAYGNDAANGVTVNPGQLSTGVVGGFASVANVTNVQTVGGDSAILASATGGNVVHTNVDESVDDSSVSTSGNAIQALAYGNRSTGNTLNVQATNIDSAPALGDATRGGATVTGSGDAALVTNASFSVQNAQSGQGSVTATQRNGLIDAAQVRVDAGEDVTNSSIAADNNLSTASATSNSAVNALGLAATGLQTTSAVQNVQTTNAHVEADIGLAGSPGSAGFTTTASGNGVGTLSSSGNTLTVSGAPVTVTFSDHTLTADEAAYLNSLTNISGAVAGGNTITLGVGNIDTSVFSNFSFSSGADGVNSGDESISLTGFSDPGTAGVPGAGGVTIAVDGPVSASQLSVTGNTNAGSVTGNNAANTLTVAATNIANGSGLTSSTAGLVGTDVLDNTILGAVADHALSNTQSVDGGTLTSDVLGTFAIDTTADAAVGASTLSVANNKQSASSVANTAVNTLNVGDQNTSSISAGSALSSFQSANAGVAASSDVELFAPAAVTSSTVNLTGNSNTSLGVLNDVSNTLTVQAANIAPVDVASNVNLTGVGVAGTAVGDHVLSNNQSADTGVTSTASTNLYNEDRIATATSGLVNSSLTIGDNSTVAEASANRALNTLSIAGGASQGANAGIANTQTNSALALADATTSATLTLAGNPGDPAATPTPIPASAALNGSSATISGNSTTALARGNAATNVLNASAGSSYGPVGGGAGSTIGATASVAAVAGVLNSQANSGNVSAQSLNATYTVALNATLGNPAVSNGTIGVTDNQVAAQAYGNSATNSVTLAALNTGAPTAAIGNYQVNTGVIRATATTVSFGATGVGAVAGSSLGVTGNQVAATAIGNSAISSITAAR